ncbi:unnamed protein product, partial [Oikopleura dioica]
MERSARLLAIGTLLLTRFAPPPANAQFAEFADLEDEEKETASPTFTSLWLASIWWEAGYQQGRGESKYPSCNEIRMAMKAKKSFDEYQLPDCDASGLWTPLQCSDKNCWCVFVDSGYRIQKVPFGEVDSMLICPKMYLFKTDPCNVAQTPLFTCRNVRVSKQKWIYNSISKKCEVQESCTGFASAQECTNTCAAEPADRALCRRGSFKTDARAVLLRPKQERMRQVRLWQLRGQLKQLPEQFGVFGNLYQGHHGHCSGAHWPTTGQSAATCLACRPTRLVRDRTAGYCSRRASNGISVRQAATFVRHRASVALTSPHGTMTAKPTPARSLFGEGAGDGLKESSRIIL